MYTLHYFPGNASLMPHMLLRELGVPFELRLVDRAKDAQKCPKYLKLNPTGRIPVLIHDGKPIYETAAIALYLADRHPEARLAPALHDAARGDHLKWMVLFTNAFQCQFRAWFYADEFVDNPAYVDSVKAATATRIGASFAQLGTHLDINTWLLGDGFSAADLYLFMFIRWGRALPTAPRVIPSLNRLAEAVAARPAVAKAFEVEGLTAPFF
ncbi:MAG: glutathione S-transferase family protein [Rhizomicrobium sp.]